MSKGSMIVDQEQLSPLLKLPIPDNMHTLWWAIDMFAHCSKWIVSFSEKIWLLIQTYSFPLLFATMEAFKNFRIDIAGSVIFAIDLDAPLVVVTDATEYAIAASLWQSSDPVTFFQRPCHDLNSVILKKTANSAIFAIDLDGGDRCIQICNCCLTKTIYWPCYFFFFKRKPVRLWTVILSIKKKAYSIVGALRRWRHYLNGISG